MKKAALHNLGCKVNAYETEAMQQMLEEAGYAIVPFDEYADVYVINTCSVTNMADRKSRQMLRRAKKKNPNAIVVGAGCYVQTMSERDGDFAQQEYIDIAIGNNQKHKLVSLLEEWQSSHTRQQSICAINSGTYPYETLAIRRTDQHTRAFLKIQDGCNQFCSYCIIPFARGRVRSRPMREVVEEAEKLAASGCREIVLTGIHLSSYGLDTGDDLICLIQELHCIDGIRRIRLGSLEPRIVTEAFVKQLAALEKVCAHFHLSLQSGCDTVLARMNRRYTTEEYERGCRLLRRYYTHPAITTDVIAGFPQETEEEFEQTKAFVRKIRFYEMHIFKYSARAGTRAEAMDGQVSEQIKVRRSNELLAVGEQMSKEFREYYTGKYVTALLEEPFVFEGKRYMAGYTKEYVKVAYETPENLQNVIKTGRIRRRLTAEIYLLVEF